MLAIHDALVEDGDGQERYAFEGEMLHVVANDYDPDDSWTLDPEDGLYDLSHMVWERLPFRNEQEESAFELRRLRRSGGRRRSLKRRLATTSCL